MLCDEKRPTPDMVEAAYLQNDKGAGIAWREKEGQEVWWKKGLILEQIQKMVATVPLPFVCHFRIPSMGMDHPLLTHPFPVSEKSHLALEGHGRTPVLFHNGHWSDWKKTMFQITVSSREKVKLPEGAKWSDSRAMAFLAGRYGTSFLELLDEKVITFGPGEEEEGIEIFGKGWVEVDGIWCSNDHWKSKLSQIKWRQGSRPALPPPSSKIGGAQDPTYTTPPASMVKPSFKGDADGRGSTPPTPARDTTLAKQIARVKDITWEVLGSGVPAIGNPFLSLEEAEEAHKKGKLSKNKLKKWRKLFDQAAWEERKKLQSSQKKEGGS